MKRPQLPVVCSIGSTDPTGAAGIGLDLQVYARLRTRGVFAIAAVTAQNSARVLQVQPLPKAVFVAQLKAIWEQVRPDAIRIGLMPSADAVRALRRFLRRLRSRPPIVLDPILASSSGTRFVDARTLAELRRLLPLATLITPNAAEARVLAHMKIDDVAGAERAARELAAIGCWVLVKGGHLGGSDCIDVLAHRNQLVRLRSRRLRRDVRGLGCLLAAAIAAGLAHGRDVERAVREARRFVRAVIRSAPPLGAGRFQYAP